MGVPGGLFALKRLWSPRDVIRQADYAPETIRHQDRAAAVREREYTV